MSDSYHHGSLPVLLVASALEMLREGGEAGLSLRSLARRAGVSPNAPYRHYADKSALLAAVAAAGFDQLRELLLTADRRARPGRAIAAQGVAYMRFALKNRALFHLMFGPEGHSTSLEREVASEAAYRVLLDRVAADFPVDGKPELQGLAFWSTIHGLTTLAVDDRIADKGDPETVMKQALALFEK